MRNLGASAEAAGIAPERLVFATRVPRVEDHLARYLVADLFLDTWPYNAHTTAADALRAGLPVITCEGQAFPARVAASLLRTFGLPELVTSSLEAYFDLALSLSRSPRRIQKLRQRLASLDGHPAFGPAFTRSLEKALDSVTPARVEPAAQPAQAAPTAAEEAEAFHREHMAGRPWVAVHLRGSHQGSGSPYAAYHGFVERIIELNPTIGVFLLADDAPAIAEYTARYGDRLLCAPAARSGDRIGAQPGVPLGEEVPVDTLLALKCDYFIGNKESNASLAIKGLKDWAQGFCFLLAGAETSLSPHPQEQPEARACRLCGGPLQEAFSRKVLGKYDVKYYRCLGCASLQTEAPYWLEEAYGPQAERFDTGKASRTLVNFLLMKRLFEILELRPGDRCADFGGGTGLFARLMRDAGFNVFNYDKYGSGEFCSGLTWKAFEHPVKATTVFEVVEHFSDPAAEWEILFRSTSDYIIGSTGLYADQDPDWFYLCPEGGQHIFFHSVQALIHVAAGHGWSAYLVGGYFLLCRRPLAEAAAQALQPWISNPLDTVRQTFESWVKNPYACATADSQRQQALARLRSPGARIALDGTFFRFASGISRLWRQLLMEWSANGFGEFLVVLDRNHTAPRLPGLTYVDIPPEGWAGREADRGMLQQVCDAHGITAFMSTYYTLPLATPSLLMAYDMIPEVLGFDRDDPQWDHKREAIRCASHFMAISDSTADDLVRFFPQVARAEIRRTHCGTDFRTPAPAQVADFKARHGIDRPYFMLSGDRSGYKNGILAFKAFALLGDRRKDFALVCTHSMPITDPELLALLGEGKVLPLILSDEDLQCAYAGAQALIYPSRYEGFGLPVLEAMACSCPVVTCRNSSIPEVAGDAALFVDPDDPAALHAALLSLEDPELRAGLIRKGLRQAEGFTWRRMAEEVEAAICHWLAPS